MAVRTAVIVTTLLCAVVAASMENEEFFEEVFDCSEEERSCFEINTIYSEATRSCHLPGTRGPCPPGYLFAVSRVRAERGDITGACVYACPKGYRRPADQTHQGPYICQRMSRPKCFRSERRVVNIFGEVECGSKFSRLTSNSKEVALDLCSLPRTDSVVDPHDVHSWCLREGKFLVKGRCYTVLEQGPCKLGEWLIAEPRALVFGHIVPVCVNRPCPEGEMLLEVDGKCHSIRKANDVLCYSKNTDIRFDISGMPYCHVEKHGYFANPRSRRLCVKRNGRCQPVHTISRSKIVLF